MSLMSSESHARSSVEATTVCYDTVYLRRLPVLRCDGAEEDALDPKADAENSNSNHNADDDADDTVLLSHPLLGEAL